MENFAGASDVVWKAKVRNASLSSHMDTVTSTQAAVSYTCGDFKHDPRQVLLQYFDAHLYLANWGRFVQGQRRVGSILEEAGRMEQEDLRQRKAEAEQKRIRKLLDLAIYQNRLLKFQERFLVIKEKYRSRPTLQERFKHAGL